MSALTQHLEELKKSWGRARQQWLGVREAWRDEAAQGFEKEQWNVLEQQIPRVLEALEVLRNESKRALEQLK